MATLSYKNNYNDRYQPTQHSQQQRVNQFEENFDEDSQDDEDIIQVEPLDEDRRRKVDETILIASQHQSKISLPQRSVQTQPYFNQSYQNNPINLNQSQSQGQSYKIRNEPKPSVNQQYYDRPPLANQVLQTQTPVQRSYETQNFKLTSSQIEPPAPQRYTIRRKFSKPLYEQPQTYAPQTPPPQPKPQQKSTPPPQASTYRPITTDIKGCLDKSRQAQGALSQVALEPNSKLSLNDYSGPETCEIFKIINGKIELNQDLNKILSKDFNEIQLISMTGAQKSGRSTLLNAVLHNNKSPFGPKGVRMYTSPIQTEKTSFYFVDSADDPLADAFSYLISTTILFNTIGPLNSKQTDCLKGLEVLSHRVQNFSQLMPRFIWVQSEQLNSEPISNMISFLYQLKLGHIFEENIKSKDIQAVPQRGSTEYNHGCEQLREKLILGGAPKQVNGVNLTGPLMFSFISHIANMLNSQQNLNLEQMWPKITEDFTVFIYNKCMRSYQSEITNFLNQPLIMDEIQVYKHFTGYREKLVYQEFTAAYLSNKNRYYQPYKTKLMNFLEEKEKLMNQYTVGLSVEDNHKLIDENLSKIRGSDQNRFLSSFEEMLGVINKQMIPRTAVYTFQQSMLKQYPRIIGELTEQYQKKGMAQGSVHINNNKEDLVEKTRELERQLEKLEKDVLTSEKRVELLRQQLKDKQREIQVEREDQQPVDPAVQAANDERIFNLKQDLSNKDSEARTLKKQVIDLRQKQKQQEESGCVIQ